jgi:hypothetical protein
VKAYAFSFKACSSFFFFAAAASKTVSYDLRSASPAIWMAPMNFFITAKMLET